LHPVLAEQAEVHVADLAGRPSVEQVLAVRLDALEHCAIHPFGVGIEAALWTGDTNRVADEQFGVVAGDAVDGVALGHAQRRYCLR
jgi:hypothetical protein